MTQDTNKLYQEVVEMELDLPPTVVEWIDKTTARTGLSADSVVMYACLKAIIEGDKPKT